MYKHAVNKDLIFNNYNLTRDESKNKFEKRKFSKNHTQKHLIPHQKLLFSTVLQHVIFSLQGDQKSLA